MAPSADSVPADLEKLFEDIEALPEEDLDFGYTVEAEEKVLKYDNLEAVAKLERSQEYHDIMAKITAAMKNGCIKSDRFDSEYQLTIDCNALCLDIDNEIAIIYNFIRYKYFNCPELHLDPIEYCKVVRNIANKRALTWDDLEGLPKPSTRLVVLLALQDCNMPLFQEETLQKTLDACGQALALHETKKKVLAFVESMMDYIAPNLSAIIGGDLGAKLMGIAGGLSPLANMPSCNLQILGAKRKILAGFSTMTTLPHVGLLFHSDIVQSTPPPLQIRAFHLVAGKCTLAARVDVVQGDPSGNIGKNLREEILRKIKKWQQLPPPKQVKALPVPYSNPKKKRGGRRLRKMKERYAMTDMRKLANRIKFAVPEVSSLGYGLGEGYGMLGQFRNGVPVVQNKLALKVKRFKKKQDGSTIGVTSTLAFNPTQGIELLNPQDQVECGIQSRYFQSHNIR